MTTIACKEMNGIIEIASDSCCNSSAIQLINKLALINKTIIASSGYLRDSDLFEHFLKENPLKKSSKKHDFKSIVYSHLLKFLDFYSKYFPIAGFNHSQFILIHENSVFQIHGATVLKIEPGAGCALGSGTPFALASMLNGRSPMLAVKDACTFDINSRPPIHKMTVDKASGEIKYFKHDFSI